MAKYVIHLELSAVRQDPAASGELRPGDDPMNAIAGSVLKAMGSGPGLAGPPPGVSVRKTFPVTAESFAALCELLGRFDDLAERIECEHP